MSVNYLIHSYNTGRMLIFDLDNTLYDETLFLFNAYNQIADLYKIQKKNEIYHFLVSEFKDKGRTKLFDKLIAKFPNYNINIDKCLYILRSYSCKGCINVYPWFDQFIKRVNPNFKLKIITNGNIKQQKNKIKSLNIPVNKKDIEIVFAKGIIEKPCIDSFYELENFNTFNRPIYIGDSDVDQKFCNSLGIEFYDVTKLT